MSISFQCPRCGKKLKAPDSAAGKSSSCPGCGGTVTCPVPGDDERSRRDATDPGRSPKDLTRSPTMDDDKPYGMVAAPASARLRRDHGDAAKCRFAASPRAVPANRKAQERQGKEESRAEEHRSLSERYLIICIFDSDICFHCLLRLGHACFSPDPANPVAAESSRSSICLARRFAGLGIAATVFAFLLTHEGLERRRRDPRASVEHSSCAWA